MEKVEDELRDAVTRTSQERDDVSQERDDVVEQLTEIQASVSSQEAQIKYVYQQHKLNLKINFEG